MFATAISANPAATSSGPRVSPVSAVICSLSSVNFAFVISAIQRLVAAFAEDLREVVRLDPAEQHVGVGDGERAAAPVAGGAGVGAGRVGAGPVPAAVEVQDGAAARGHGVDGQHRGAHPHPGDLRLVLALELAREVRHVGRGAAHVEADRLGEARVRGRAGHADDAAGRAGQDGVLAAEARRVGQPAVGLHEQQPDVLRARPRPRSRTAAGWATGRRPPRWCRPGRPASSAGWSGATPTPG